MFRGEYLSELSKTIVFECTTHGSGCVFSNIDKINAFVMFRVVFSNINNILVCF